MTCMYRCLDHHVKTHVAAGRGGLLDFDELLPERSRQVALDDPAATVIQLAEELFPYDGNWSKYGTVGRVGCVTGDRSSLLRVR